MHPWEPLGCVQCHGGDGRRADKDGAHVRAKNGWPGDERVLPQGFDPAAVRFRNPSDLRVAEQTCGQCHARELLRLRTSLHGTTAGHLCDGLYENGVLTTRRSKFGVFGVIDTDGEVGGLPSVQPLAELRVPREPKTLGDHFTDLPRKACAQCHLWSEGVAVAGRLGQDGLYRGGGCAACHVSYSEDGRSRSADAAADHAEPGHPITHAMTVAPPVETCTHCHVGDAAIGNDFRGLAQLYPQQPAGPDVPGTTSRLLANQFFIQDPVLTPPDVHGARGMACIDCHTVRDIMGDGDLHGAMEHAVEIECVDCHGTFAVPSTLQTLRGRPLPHLERRGDLVWLTGKVDGRARRVKQAHDVVDPAHPDFNPRAAAAMTPEHAGLECYACHAGWSTNFFGFHFDRNLGFTQLDLVSGSRTPGRVSTSERVFATLRHLTLGVDADGLVAPFVVGFSSMGTVHGEDGALLLDQALPRTAAGLSGMSMVPHQTHTVQPVARACVECHRSPATWGLGTGDASTSSFALARGWLYVAGERGLDTLLYDRVNPDQTLYVARLPLGGASKVIVDSDPLDGTAGTAFVVIEHAGVALVDVRNPAFPRVRSFAAAGDARDAALAGDLLVIANGVGGVRLVDVKDRDRPVLVSDLVTDEARGVCVQWPRVLVADGPGGLLIADISAPAAPRVAGVSRLAGPDTTGQSDANAVAAIFQYGRPQGSGARTPARMLAAVANGRFGLAIVDVTEPAAARQLTPPYGRLAERLDALDVAVTSRFDLGDTAGQRPTVEHDVAYVLYGDPVVGATVIWDLTDPSAPESLARQPVGPGTGAPPVHALTLVKSFNPPELVSRLLLAGEGGVYFQDVTRSSEIRNGALLPGAPGTRSVAAEAFAFDRMLDETGRQLKDISHEGVRYLTTSEIHGVLTVPGEALGVLEDGGSARQAVDQNFGDRGVAGGQDGASLNVRRADPLADAAMLQRLGGGFRIAAEEDLARLVRHAWPPQFDDNRDRALSRGELENLVWWVLDANGDARLDRLEWPRHPGADPGALDRNRDGQLSRAEMDLRAEVVKYFDTDGDGLAQFSEWPFTVDDDPLPSFYYAELPSLQRLIEAPGFETRRPRLYRAVAGLGDDGRRDSEELAVYLQQLIDLSRTNPLIDVAGEPASPGFVERFDLDGDRAVDAGEFPGFARLSARCDRNGDGRIGAKDRP
jgi:LVIVD repeat